MKYLLTQIALLLFVCIAPLSVCHADTFKGKVVNAETGEPLVGANINSEINPQPGWSIQNYTETDSTGCFYLNSGWEGRIMLKFSMIGYKSTRKVDYSYGEEVKDTTDLGTIRLQPTALMLQEVEVKGHIPRITMSGDTIVFNPDAFKLKEGARLDELIKKLPGVQNRDGKLYWNDKPIRLMMNGKDLFGGDQIVGELPAEVANKIKLYDRKSELARHTGSDEGEEDHVLDIQVKPGFLDKWYGEVEAQYQTKKRYMFDVRASKLSDHDPQMIYAQANNANRYIDRTMRQTMNRNIDGDGKSQYGSYNYQHNWQTKGAENFDNNSIDFSANLGHSDGWNTFNQSTETFFPDKDRTFALSRRHRNKHNVTPQIQANLFAYTDSLNTITVKAHATYAKSRTTNQTDAASYGYEPDKFKYHTLDAALAAKPGDALYNQLITRSRNYQTDDEQTRQLVIDYAWVHYLGKKGSFSLSGRTNLNGNNSDTYINRNLEYLREGSSEKQWQYYDYTKHNASTSIKAAFDYWLGKKVYFNISDNLMYTRTRVGRNFYADTDEHNVSNNMPTTLDANNALHYLLHTWTNTVTLKSTITPSKKLMIMPKLDWTVNRESTDYQYGRLDTAAVRISHAIEPSIFLKWKMNRVRSMDLSFAYNTTVPDLISTFGYRNTIDPLQISEGNPLLHNSHSHTTTFGYHRMWLRKQIVLGVSASYRKDINPTATLYRYNSNTGVYESKPMNVKGGDEWKFGFNYDQGLGVYFRLMNKFALSKSQSYGFLTIVDNADPQAKADLNHQRLLGINENLELTYETEKLSLTLFNDLTLNRYRYDDASYNSRPVYNSAGIIARIKLSPVELWIRLADDFRSGYQTAEMNGHKLMSNASINYSFCKNKCRLALWVDDIFNKDIYYESEYSAYQRVENSANYLHHYMNLTFTYRFDAKAKKK